MEQNTKKHIAREILILTTILVATLLCWLAIYPYNAFKKQQISTTEKQIELQNVEMDSLRLKLPSEKRLQLYQYLKTNYNDVVGDMEQDEFMNRYSDSTKRSQLYDYLKTEIPDVVGDMAHDEFMNRYGDDLSENSGSSKLKKIESNKEVLVKSIEDNKAKIFTSDEHKNLFIKVLGVLFCLAYPLRFLFLAVKWSLKTLKE